MLKLKHICFIGGALFNTSIQASNIVINTGSFGDWDTAVTFQLGPNSTYNSEYLDEPGSGSSSSINGGLTIYLNQSYIGTPATVGVSFDNAYIGDPSNTLENTFDPFGNTLVFTLNENPTSTNTLDFHSQDYYACSEYPVDPSCLTFDDGNSIFSDYPSFGTVESGYDIELNLGFISFVNNGDGNTTSFINHYDHGTGHVQMSLSMMESDNSFSSSSYTFESNPVPIPASIWLFISGIASLVSVSKYKNSKAV